MTFSDSTAIVSNFSSALNIILLITAVSLGALNIRNKYEKGNDADAIENLKATNETYISRRASDQVLIETMREQLAVEKQKSTILESHVTQAPDITKLIDVLAKQHKETSQSNKSIIEGLSNVAKELGSLAKAISKDSNG